VADRQIIFDRLALESSNADDLVSLRDPEGKIVKGPFSKSIQVRIPGGAGADVETSLSGLFQNLIARVLDVNGLVLADWWRVRKNCVK